MREEQSERTGISADRVVAELEKMAFAETEITEKSKIKALEMLGKHLGMFTEKVEITKEGEIPKLLDALQEKSPTE